MRTLGILCALAALTGAEPACTLAWDQAGVRNALPITRPASLWYTDQAVEARRNLGQLARDLRRLDPRLPDLERLWQEGRAGALAISAGSVRWRFDAGAAADQAQESAARLLPGTVIVREGAVLVAGLDAQPIPAPPAVLRCDAVGFARLLPAGLAADGAAVGATIAAVDGAWRGEVRSSGLDTGLRPLDQGFIARLPERAFTCALKLDPARAAVLLQAHAGPMIGYLTGTLGLTPDQAAGCFTGEMSVQMTGDRPLPRLLVVARLAPLDDRRGLLQNLGDAFGGRPATLAGAKRAWVLPSPLGALHLALTDDLLLVGNDEQGLAAVLAGTPGPLRVQGEAAIIQADVATVGGWLALARLQQRPLALLDDPLPALLGQVRDSAWALVQQGGACDPAASLRAGEARTVRLPAGTTRTFTTSPDTAARLTALLAGDPVAALAASAAFHADQGRAVLALRLGDESWLVADGGGRPRRCTRAQLDELVAALPLRWGAAADRQQPVAIPDARFDQRCIPVITTDHLPPWTVAVRADGPGWRLEETGLPVVTGGLVAVLVREALSRPPRPLPVEQ